MPKYNPGEILSFVDKYGGVTLEGNNDLMLKVGKGKDCYFVFQGSPETGYGQDLKLRDETLKFIRKALSDDEYNRITIE